MATNAPSLFTVSETPKASSTGCAAVVKGDSPAAGHGSVGYARSDSPAVPCVAVARTAVPATRTQGESAPAYDQAAMVQRSQHAAPRLSRAYGEFLRGNGEVIHEDAMAEPPRLFSTAETPRSSTPTRSGTMKGDSASPAASASSYTRSDTPQVHRQDHLKREIVSPNYLRYLQRLSASRQR